LSNNPAPAHLTPRRITPGETTPIDRESWAVVMPVGRPNYRVRLASQHDWRLITIIRALLVDCVIPSLLLTLFAHFTIGGYMLSANLQTVLPYRLSPNYWAMAPDWLYPSADLGFVVEFALRFARVVWAMFFAIILPTLLLTLLCQLTIGGFMFYGSLGPARRAWRNW